MTVSIYLQEDGSGGGFLLLEDVPGVLLDESSVVVGFIGNEAPVGLLLSTGDLVGNLMPVGSAPSTTFMVDG